MRIKKRKVAVAMSGGVDSGVAAALVVKAGYQAAGFHMRLWQESHLGGVQFENKCCSTESLEAARKTAHQLGIPFNIVDFEEIFKKRVVDYFLKEYGLGRTPNPCVMCNKFIKFGELLDYARKLRYDYLATGHYARITREIKKKNEKIKIYHLLAGVDKLKDQSYFLYNLTQKQLAHVLFPVGEYTKKQVVAMAKKWKLPVATRPESQEICFFPESDYRPFLKRQIKGKIIPGEVVDTKGKVIGKHQGIPLYTIGQRHGFEIRVKEQESRRAKRGIIPPYYVIGKDIKKNQLVVGFGKEAEIPSFWVKNVNWVGLTTINNQLSTKGLRCKVRIRHQGKLFGCRIKVKTPRRRSTSRPPSEVKEIKEVRVILDEGERGVSPGQAAVFYVPSEVSTKLGQGKTHEVLGGGIIAIDKGK